VTDALRPPVNEVVLSVGLARQVALSGPQLPAILGDWFSQHPRVETAPPYEIPPEPEELTGAFYAPGLAFMGQPEPRYWLVSQDDQELLQVQNSYLALNWRSRNETSSYPGFGEMKSRFSNLLETVKNGLSRHEGTFKPTRAELTYIDIIRPGALWSAHQDTHKLLNVTLPSDTSYEQLSFAYSKQLWRSSEKFIGRLHVAVTPVLDWVKQEPQLNLNFTARSADFQDSEIGSVLEFMDMAHAEIEDSFHRLVSKQALTAWGIE